MVLIREYRICMPLTLEEYQIGQLYTIARHSHEQSESGEGVEVIVNTACEDEVHGKGQYTEKRIHLSSRLPYWIQSFLPKVFYLTEKAWNYYPFTITEYTCSFLPKLCISIQTKFESNNGSTENCLGLTPEELSNRIVDFIDIVYDEVPLKSYKEEEDLRFFHSKSTGRGPLPEGWRESVTPVMCSYKVINASFEVWGIQTRAEELVHKTIRDILLLGHRQAFAWIDEWYGLSQSDVRIYESEMQRKTNAKVASTEQPLPSPSSLSPNMTGTPGTPPTASPTSPAVAPRSWFSWS
ncbi:cytoplasmic phosphatidylinositol transfer protein 1 [Lycorma delicatula]|uniref:cytoplasmic phosphatidylinositol transfer protein 1 n=1 Tax=Lycorma delicatula TaxID=130591 RepID=UPI003F516887